MEVTTSMDGHDTMMQLYLDKLLADHGILVTNTQHDIQAAIDVFKSHLSEHDCATEDKDSRWFSHFTHSLRHVKGWHSTFNTQAARSFTSLEPLLD